MTDFAATIRQRCGGELQGDDLEVVQVNVGLRCNLACSHCHLEAGPRRTEVMQWQTMEAVARLANAAGRPVVDITGGAPELNPHLRQFIEALRAAGHAVQVRTNLTVLMDPEQPDWARFYRDQRIKLVASLPCYLQQNVDQQRGSGAYLGSVEGLRRLNALGYGVDPELQLDLVYNPGGPFLPPEQSRLEQDYKRQLSEQHGVVFGRLLTIANMPLGRFGAQLRKVGQLDQYESLLRSSFNADTVPGLMCRHQISVAWDGTLYDCDFNLALGLPARTPYAVHDPQLAPDELSGRSIVTAGHCFCCTAGSGSSCRGALA